MTSELAFNSIAIVVRLGLPLIILFALIIGFIRLRNVFEICSLDLRVVSILIIGGVTAGFLNIPVFFDQTRTVFVNFGAIIIPLVLSFYLIYKFSSKIIYILALIMLVSAITFLLAVPDPQLGVVVDFPHYFIPILLCVLLSVIIFGKFSKQDLRMAVPVAYCTSTLGVFIGADVLVLPAILDQDIHAGYFGEVRGEKNKDGPINFDRIHYRPELAVGRWPVNNTEEIQRLVVKTIDFENRCAKPQGDSWRIGLLAVGGWVDSRGRLDRAAAAFPDTWHVEKRYYADSRRPAKPPTWGMPTPVRAKTT